MKKPIFSLKTIFFFCSTLNRRYSFNSLLAITFILFYIQSNATTNNVINTTFVGTNGVICCPPEMNITLNSLTWSSINSIQNTGTGILSGVRLQNAIFLPAFFPQPDLVYITPINSKGPEPTTIIPLNVNNRNIQFSALPDVNVQNRAAQSTGYNSTLYPTYQWRGYQSDPFTLNPGQIISYRLVYAWTNLPVGMCRYISGWQWNGDNQLTPAPLPTIDGSDKDSIQPNGLLYFKKNTKCSDPYGNVTVIEKCDPGVTPPPSGQPYYTLIGGATPSSNTSGFFDSLSIGNYTVYLVDSSSGTQLDSAHFSISFVPETHVNSSTACDTYFWTQTGLTYTASGIYSDTFSVLVGSEYCLVDSVLNLTLDQTPTMNVTATASTITEGQPTTITASGANTYTWAPGYLSGNPITVSPASTRTYTVTGTSINGCTNTATKTIVVTPYVFTSTSMLFTIDSFRQDSANVFSYSIYCTYTGPSPIALRGYSWGLNYTNGLENGGVLSQTFLYRDPAFNTIPPLNYSVASSLNHLRATTLNATTGNEVVLSSGVRYLMARMKIKTSAASFPQNFNPWLPSSPLQAIQMVSASGRSQCIASVLVNYAPGVIYNFIGPGNVSPAPNILNILTSDMIPSPSSPNHFILNPPNTTLNLKCFIQGYWHDSTGMLPVLAYQSEPTTANACDSIDVELHDENAPYSLMYSVRTVLNQDGTATCIFPPISGNYFIAVKHRNTIQTWTSDPVTFGYIPANYDFSTSFSQAFGDNQVEVAPGVWAFFSGDINQDENIDLLDLGLLEIDISAFSFGYHPSDINGDGNVDLLDIPILETNINDFIFSYHP